VSTITQVADAVVAMLNGHSFTQAFTAERRYVPEYQLTDMEALHVTVVTSTVASEDFSRGQHTEDHVIQVGVQKRTDDDKTVNDGLMTLVEAIADFFRANRRLTTFPAAVLTRIENEPVYDLNQLREMGQFTSVLSLTYRVVR
jgi:hypothetical protein